MSAFDGPRLLRSVSKHPVFMGLLLTPLLKEDSVLCGCFMAGVRSCVVCDDPVRIVCYGVLCDPVFIVCYGRVKKFRVFRVFCV